MKVEVEEPGLTGCPTTEEASDPEIDIDKTSISYFLLLRKIGTFVINTLFNSAYPFLEDLFKYRLR
jgi:hypothetical protein